MKSPRDFSGGIAAEWTRRADPTRPETILFGGLTGLVAAALPAALLWGFTVDDALVSARVASHLARGVGYRFNADGPVVDAVTPLGWAYLLAPFARHGALAALAAARFIGLLSWLAAAAWLGGQIAACGRREVRFAPLVALAASVPLGAWAGAGMETGCVMALGALALGHGRFAPLAAGVAAGLRPELLPWASVITAASAFANRHERGGIAVALLFGLLPSALVVAARLVAFGHSYPLAVLAKPSDIEHGLRYALGALALSGAPLLVIAPVSLRALPRHERIVLLACLVHLVSVAVAGGDWMPLYRLIVPVLPGLLLVAAAIAERAPLWATALRTSLAIAACAVVAVGIGKPARHVLQHRLRLIEAAREPLRDAKRVATLDVGWVGAATDAHVIDLAGITDPTIAVLPGPHHAKKIPLGLLEARDTDTLVLLLAARQKTAMPWTDSVFERPVESRVARLVDKGEFDPVATLPLGGTEQVYLILRARASQGAAPPASGAPP